MPASACVEHDNAATTSVATIIAESRRHTRLVITSGFLYFFLSRIAALIAKTMIAIGRVTTFGNIETRSRNTARSEILDIEA